MAITFRSESHITPGAPGSSTLTLTEPAGATTDDLLFGVIYVEGSTITSTPSGWHTLRQGTSVGVTVFDYWIGYIVRGASAPSLTATSAATGTWFEFSIVAYSGCSTVDPVGPFKFESPGAATTIEPPPVLPRRPGCMILSGGLNQQGSVGTGWTVSSGHTMRSYNATFVDIAVQELQQSGGPLGVDPATITGAFGSGTNVGFSTCLQEPYTAPGNLTPGNGRFPLRSSWVNS